MKRPDVYNRKRLRRLIQFVQATNSLNLTLEADVIWVVRWWIDAANALQIDMKLNSVVVMTIGKGMMY